MTVTIIPIKLAENRLNDKNDLKGKSKGVKNYEFC